MKIHHIGYLVKKLPEAAEAFENLGYVSRGGITDDTLRGVDILFMEKDGYVIELVSPNRPDSVAAGLLKTRKNSPYHICYLCGELEQELAVLTASGYVQIDEPTPAPALENRRVCFLVHPQLGMIELLEENRT